MTHDTDLIARVAKTHGVPEDAVAEALRALRRGNGTMAQFSHDAFGGMAQWFQGGMSMVGDMFNAKTKATFNAVMEDLAAGLSGQGDAHAGGETAQGSQKQRGERSDPHTRWPAEFGSPASSGSQNDMHYAYFPAVRRLVIDSGEGRKIYDTGRHSITGVSQQQSGAQSLRFSSQDGDVALENLTPVD